MQSVLGFPVESLFDPVQTHAVKGVTPGMVEEVKARLKSEGATRFRLVKNSFGFTAVCFKLKSKA